MMTIRAAADGSALGNPGPAGWAWYVDDTCWAAGGWPHATNNQGELMAVLQFFRATAHLSDDLLILCDSQYVINCVTKWMPGWKKKAWRKSDGKPVLNVDLLKEIDAAIVGRTYRFEWVKGHANHPLNEAADVRARAVAEAYQRSTALPTGPGWVRIGGAEATLAAEPDTAEPETAELDAAELDAAELNYSDALFTLDAEVDFHRVTATLSHDQFARLSRLAANAGISVEQALSDFV